VVRAEPAVFRLVASGPTVSRTIDALAKDAPATLRAIHAARAVARQRVWQLACRHAPHAGIDAANPIVIDVDATLVTAHSDKEGAATTFKRGYGHHPLWAFLDHGPTGTGEPLAVLLRPGNAGSNIAADHLVMIQEALQQLPFQTSGRVGRKVLVRIDGAGATHDVVNYLHARRMSYSIGFTLPDDTADLLKLIPDRAWTPAYDAEGKVRAGAWVAELTGLLDLTEHKWPKDMRVIVRKERPPPGRPATDHRCGRAPDHRVRHQHRHRRARHPTTRPGTTPPPPGPRRGPHPVRERHWPDQPATT
jgi:Transposase DDE domain group 1